MKEELKLITKDIEELEERLRILRERENAIRSKIEIPTELIGKYVKETTYMYECYIRIDSIERTKNGTFLAKGPAIDICRDSKKTTYDTHSNYMCFLNIDDHLTFVTKEEFESELENALKNFK